VCWKRFRRFEIAACRSSDWGVPPGDISAICVAPSPAPDCPIRAATKGGIDEQDQRSGSQDVGALPFRFFGPH
jgi:hypothetical protein